jgi:hypothetical protein
LADRTHPAKASRERNASSVSSPRAARDAARIDAGAKLAISRNAWLFASFDGELGSLGSRPADREGLAPGRRLNLFETPP